MRAALLTDRGPVRPARGARVWRALACLALGLLLAACGTQGPGPVITPVLPGTQPPGSATARPPELTPAATPLPSDTPVPTATATPSATPTPTIVPDPLELVRQFSVEQALVHIEELASPRYEGRRAGTAGGDLAASYIAAEFARLGLAPAGDGGGYLQTFTFPFVDLAAVPELAIVAGTGVSATAYVHMQDFREVIAGQAGAGDAEAEVVYLAGGYDSDYQGLDVEGRIVLLDAAQRTGNTLPAIEMALTRGAAGVLVIATNDESVHLRPSYRVPDAGTLHPVLFVNSRVRNDLAAASGTTLDATPVALPVRVHMSVALQPAREAATANVLGLLPGSDAARQEKYVLIGGHYDHVGQSPSGLLFPGANDNASGVAVTLALAQSWQESGYRPPFSVLFVAWSAEESGLLGSQYYTEHPVRPLGDTISFLNLDVLGAGDGDGLLVGYGDQGLATQMVRAAHGLGYPLTSERMGSSDHVSFGTVGVPAVMLSAAGELDTLHRPDDTPDLIEPDNLAQGGQITWLTVLDLGGAWKP